MGNWLEAVIMAVIMIGMGVAIFRGGAANPVSTGGLASKMGALDRDLGTLKVTVGQVETRVAELDLRAATKGDVERIENRMLEGERKIDRLDVRMDAVDCELAAIREISATNQKVVEAIAESSRQLAQSLREIERKVDTTAAISARVPEFIEAVLADVARNAAETRYTKEQVDRLYHFLTEKALKS